MRCIWCESEQIKDCEKNSYWNTPDGRTAVEILSIPAVDCVNCGKYVTESMEQKVEEALFWNDISGLGTTFRFDELMNAPRKSGTKHR